MDKNGHEGREVFEGMDIHFLVRKLRQINIVGQKVLVLKLDRGI